LFGWGDADGKRERRGGEREPRRSPQQQQYDYFRQRQMWLDIGQMRQQMDRQEFDRKLGKKLC
jgi:hypothetical protein